ncbi:acyl carrier protein [Brevibacillus panacihumi]|uniref:acyl carrier protein n=1 Tax=Brevibacillus panacihumi TaxID=497735 RepID=UPI00042871CA|nr:phosphopantetheine-binding protein [Brevibacillus panacihumi]
MDKKAKIRSFILRASKQKNIEDHDDIFARGYVNSLFAMQLVMYLENEFSLQVENDDLELENFQSIDAIAQFVERKQLTALGLEETR